jgi:S1-C subfamily serine protease
VRLIVRPSSRIAQALALVAAAAVAPVPAQEAATPDEAVPEALAPGELPPPDFAPGDTLAVDEDWNAGPISAAAQRMLDRVRDAVVQIRGFYGSSSSEAFHGSGFVVAPNGLVVTNYHVVSRAATDNANYRLEYHTDDGSVGRLTIRAIDVAHDLALLAADGLEREPVKLQLETPARGDRAYALGYPLNLGLVITEGIANGRLENTFSPRLHYAGAMNPGMSGGPALDSKGRVFGVNVSFSTRGQLVSFLIPAEFITGLLEASRTPVQAADLRAEITRQLQAHQAAVLAALPRKFPTQTSAGYALPGELAPFVDCTATSGRAPSKRVRLQSVSCRGVAEVSVQPGLATGNFRFGHRVLIADELHPLLFAEQLRRVAATVQPPQAAGNVTPYSCRTGTVVLNGFRAGVQTCMRAYLMFDGLYDVTLVVVSRNRDRQGFVSDLNLRGMEYDTAMTFTERFLEAMRWTR